ncbi:MAG TPA: ABC transporter ATP-binding protein [Myxococcota bacterium]|nr:ABC transporter ATP-binding protein [Myxococcota bacterium]
MTETHALEIAGLQKSFVDPEGGRRPVVDVPALRLAAGEQLALSGSSGSGKTTFLHLVAGILASDAGRILVSGQDMSAASEAQRDRIRARHVGYVFQAFHLLPGYTALENVALAMRFGRGVDLERARSLLARVGLRDHESYRPPQLSVGQQQRVAVARALANRPSLVLADEPTGSLDPANARSALALIRETCRENGAALLLVSHDRDILGGFDRVLPLAEINRAALAAPARMMEGAA